ncbi:MAG: MraY family glycosyltransferase [Bacteroidota bacterium]
MYDIILSFITAFTLTYFAIPSIIHIAKVKNLCDEPGERRAHTVTTPSLGGIAIFAGMIFSIVLWTPFDIFDDLQYILCGFIIIFLIGAKDDIVPISPKMKLAGELFAAGIIVWKSNVKLTSLYGVFGIYELPEMLTIPLSIFIIIVIINAFNLIDGINGLSGSIGTLISAVLGTWFYLIDEVGLALVAFALAGALIAFLKYNFTPAKIFMGDTGSLLVGLVSSILILKFIQFHDPALITPDKQKYAVQAVPAVAIGILILPLFDTLRVFTVRVLRGRSPFSPDRNHIHHLLLDFGFSHMQATGILVAVNIGFIALVFYLHNIGLHYLLFLVVGLAVGLSASLNWTVRRKKRKLANGAT